MTFDPSSPTVLRPSRARTVGLLALSLGFVAIGVMMTRSSDTIRGIPAVYPGWLAVIFFGLGVPTFLVMLLPGASYLRLEADGYTVCTFFRPNFVPWSAVRGFGVTRVTTRKFVGINLEPDAGIATALGRVNTRLVGYQNILPNTYGMSAEKLAELMNQALSKAKLSAG